MKEVLLKESVDGLGRRGEVVKVADGYARNYLLPRKLALSVTKSNQRQVELAQAAAIEAEEQKAAQAVATRIGALECVIARRVGETDTLYGSVTSARHRRVHGDPQGRDRSTENSTCRAD